MSLENLDLTESPAGSTGEAIPKYVVQLHDFQLKTGTVGKQPNCTRLVETAGILRFSLNTVANIIDRVITLKRMSLQN